MCLQERTKSLIKTIIILPGTVVVFIPAFLLYVSCAFFNKKEFVSGQWFLVVPAFVCLIIGCVLAFSTVRLLLKVGEGTPAPWEAPKNLVIKGPYQYVRNPMISGVLFLLAGESLLFDSWLILIWLLFFFILNAFYLQFFEEKDLTKRFGSEYLEYKKNVPRWLPRCTPYAK